MRCDYCCNYGHDAGNCPHMGRHLLDPDPKFNGLRNFVGLIDGKLDSIGCSLSDGAIEAFERGEITVGDGHAA